MSGRRYSKQNKKDLLQRLERFEIVCVRIVVVFMTLLTLVRMLAGEVASLVK
jgi:hypothetical protein